MASAQDWMDLYQELKRAHTGRNIDMFMLHQAYEGNLWNLTGSPVQTDRAGRVIMRNTNRDGQTKNKPLVVNYLKGIVDDYVALLGNLPDVKVPPPGSSQQDQAFADRCERFHYGVWHASHLAIQMKAVAWWDSVMGSTVGIVWPDFKRKHPVFRFVAPYMTYTVPDDEEPFALSKAIIAERFPTRAVRETYPNADLAPTTPFAMSSTSGSPASYMASNAMTSTTIDGSTEVVKCFDKNEVVTLINGKEVARARHDMGFCPVEEIPNILVPGTRGQSDIEQSVGLAQHASFIAQAYEEYVLQDIYSPIVVEGLMEGKVPEDINPMNPNTIIPVNIGGKVSRLGAGQGSTVVGQELTRTQGLIEYMTGVPQVRMEGSMKSSITTGRGIDRAQGPYFSRTQYRTDILAFKLERLNSMAVRMQTRMFPKAKFTMMGMKGRGGQTYKMEMTTKELDDYDFNKVLYSMAMGMDPMQRMVFVKQGMSGDSPLFDRRWGIEFLGITDHPDEMIERADRDQEKIIERQVRLRQAAQGGNAAGQQARLEGGGTPPAPLVAAEGGSAPSPLSVPIGRTPPRTSASLPLPQPRPTARPHSRSTRTRRPRRRSRRTTSDSPPRSWSRSRASSRGLALKGAVFAAEQGDRVRITAEKMADAKKIHNALSGLFGKRVSVRTSKVVPTGAIDISKNGGAPAPEGVPA
jgi:hypothetical protein